MPRGMTKEGEAKVIRAISRACAGVQSGLSPTAAVEKVAREEGLGPDMIRLVAYGYNTGASEWHREKEGSTLERFADFPLADPEQAIESIYPKAPAEKAASCQGVSLDWSLPPSGRPPTRRALEKAASATAEPDQGQSPLSDGWSWAKQAWELERSARRQQEKSVLHVQNAERQRQKQSAARDELLLAAGGLADWYKRAGAQPAVTFGELAFAAREELGRPAEAVVKAAAAELGQAEIRQRPPRQAVDWERAPYSLAKQAAQALGKLAELTPPPAKPAPPPETISPILSKRAGLPQVMLASGIGSSLGRSITPKPTDELVRGMVGQLSDPAHEQELRRIRAESMLQDFISNDEVLSGYSPEDVYSVYNEIASATPQVASQPALVRPILRKHLAQGAIEPFEASELANLEKTLGQARGPEPRQQDKQSGVLARRRHPILG